MTPAIEAARREQVNHAVHAYEHDAASESYGLEAAEKLGLSPERVFKTLVVGVEGGELAVAIVPVSKQLSLKNMARALKVKKAAMAEPAAVQRSTGYVLGGVSPLGQKKRLRTVIDASAQAFDTIFVSAGRRGLEIELSAQDLVDLVSGLFAPIEQ